MSNPASQPQVSFLTSLLRDRDCDTMLADAGVSAADFLAAVSTDKAAASQAITVLKGLPFRTKATTVAPGVTIGAPVRTNAHGSKCATCGVWVEAGAGVLGGSRQTGWKVTHQVCPTPAPAAPVVEVAEGLYISPSDSQVWKVYTTQNGRLGVMTPDLAKMAEHKAAKARGENVRRSKALQYVKGGMTMVAKRAAAGDLRPMTQDEAARFGRIHASCCNCGLPLDDDRSVAAGFGPVCARNHGWHWPTLAEAAEILGREVRPDAPAFEVVGSMVVDVDDAEGCEDCSDPTDVIPGKVCRECRIARGEYDEEPF